MDEKQTNDTNSKKRVLMVHNFYQIGGGEHTVFENEVRLLREHGHEVVTYTRDNSELKNSATKKVLLPLTTVFSLRTYKDVKRIINNEKIDIVHCHNTFPLISPSVYYASWRKGVPVVQTIHNFRFICPNGVFFRDNKICEDCLNNGLFCGINHSCYRNSKIQTVVLVGMLCIHRVLRTYRKLNYIFLTDFNKGKFRKLLGNRLDQQFTKANFEYISRPKSSTIRDGSYVFIGRFDKNKGIDFLVDNWRCDRDMFIFGNGALVDYVKLACDQNEHLHYMGFQPQEVLWQYLAKANAMLFPTDLYEGFPMTIIESLAFGTPVICSDIGNRADIVKKNKAGVLYKRRDVSALFEAINQVEDNFEYFSCNARTAYEKQYTPEANYKQLNSIYEAISL